MNLSSEIRGLQERIVALNRAARDLGGAGFVDAMMEGERGVQRDAMINSPVLTGTLRSSIVAEPPIVMGGGVVGVVGTNVEYGPYQEFGTKRGIIPKLFFTRAYESNKDRIAALFKAAAEKALQ